MNGATWAIITTSRARSFVSSSSLRSASSSPQSTLHELDSAAPLLLLGHHALGYVRDLEGPFGAFGYELLAMGEPTFNALSILSTASDVHYSQQSQDSQQFHSNSCWYEP